MSDIQLVFIVLIGLLLTISLILSSSERMKLLKRNKLLCRENHRLRLKLKEYEDSSKG